MEFANMDAFTFWKVQEEKATCSLFISEHGWYSTEKNKILKYVCHRSGYYKRKGKGIRHIKTQGTKKIDGFCPAGIKLTVCHVSGTCFVEYTSTHAGHTSDNLGHLTLTTKERENFALKIASKIPFQVILDEVRDSICNSELDRTHLLTKKDLHNIQQTFNLNNEAIRHTNDAVSIESWVKEVESSGCVLFYKPQDISLLEHQNLKKEDFILIIMNMGQLEILEKFADDCICLDGTHGLNPYDFQLHTLLVLDDLREGFPCAFLFSNRSDVEILVLFFSCIKEKMKRQIKPRVFMSDMEKTFYNAWIRVMKPADFRIYCTWHVDRSWRKNLNKIHSKEKQVMVYKQLRTILQELDQNAFTQMIDNFLRALVNDADTCEFGQYFKRYYTENVEAWAYCHRLHSGLNTNMHIERMHETIKYIYLNGKVVKRLDKAINALMKFVRDKLFERLITLNKGKISSKLKDLRARHKTSEGMDLKLVMVTEEGWEVPSALCQDLYKVEARKINCTCKLVCQQCHACIHQYSCSCIDSSVKWNMCKHVHLVCRFLNDRKELEVGNITQGPVPNASILQIDDGISSKVEEEQKILAAISQNTSISEENLYDEKEKLKMEVMELIHDIDKISTREEISALKKLVGPIKPTLHAIRLQQSRDLQHSMGASSKVHHNKNIKQQRRLFKTKKKTKKETVGLSNPGTEEINQIAINLLQLS
ncbi:hypothetical protein PPYR_06892 [Photinus pyralis]|uniref:MULE transposase domain-containing protein n=3 Tax=Photinus pyralis TaxID=7054 RepID=A0A5N4ANT5_PHOPY|nr:uncharacterized protein LOC116167670 isoform X2 [Photinus pyralis]KAB0799012.1 hypothetical protein PPYR_06892 [Photinus pyralis]